MARSPACRPCLPRLELAFRIDQEVAGSHDALAGLEAAEDFNAVADWTPILTSRGSKTPLPRSRKTTLAVAGIEHRRLRHHQPPRAAGLELHFAVHVGLEGEAGVIEREPHFERARGRVHLRQNVADAAAKHAAGRGRQRQSGRLIEAHGRGFVFVDVGDHPDGREIGHRIEHGFGSHVLLGIGIALHDEAREGRFESEVFDGLAGARDFVELAAADVEQIEALPRRGHQVGGALGHLVHRVAAHGPLCAQGQQVLLLGGQRFGTVDGQQGFALADLPAGEIGEDFVDPTFQAALDFRNARFIERHAGRGADGFGDGFVFGGAKGNPDELLLLRCDPHGAGRKRPGGGSRRGAGVDRLQFHAAIGGDARLVGFVLRVHGIHPIQDLARRRGGRGGPAEPSGVNISAGESGGDQENDGEFLHGLVSIPVSSSRRARATSDRMISSWYISSLSTTFMKFEKTVTKSTAPFRTRPGTIRAPAGLRV